MRDIMVKVRRRRPAAADAQHDLDAYDAVIRATEDVPPDELKQQEKRQLMEEKVRPRELQERNDDVHGQETVVASCQPIRTSLC